MAKVEVVLHGDLKEAYAGKICIEANSFRAVLSALKLIPELNPRNNKNRYLSKIEGLEHVLDLDKPLTSNVVDIYCQKKLLRTEIKGSGSNPYVQMIVGVVLIVVGVYMMSAMSPITQKLGLALAASGFGMIFGGMAQLLMSDPRMPDSEFNKNQSLTGYENTVASGTPIPLILGEHIHGGHIFSFNTETRYGTELDLKQFKSQFSSEGSPSWILLYDGSDPEDDTDKRPPGGRGGDGDLTSPYYPMQ